MVGQKKMLSTQYLGTEKTATLLICGVQLPDGLVGGVVGAAFPPSCTRLLINKELIRTRKYYSRLEHTIVGRDLQALNIIQYFATHPWQALGCQKKWTAHLFCYLF